MIRKWDFKKGIYSCSFGITDTADLILTVNSNTVPCYLSDGGIVFKRPLLLNKGGEEVSVKGFNVSFYEEALKVLSDLKEEIFKKKMEKFLKGDSVKISTFWESSIDGRIEQEKYEVCVNNKLYAFNKRFIFDLGEVVNPLYEVSPGVSSCIVSMRENEPMFFSDYIDGNWKKIRLLTDDEVRAVEIIFNYHDWAFQCRFN